MYSELIAIIHNRRLKWSKDSTLDQRRSTAGVYTCIGRVAEKETKESTNINVQCEYRILQVQYSFVVLNMIR